MSNGDPPQPAPGAMILFDSITAPLTPGRYRLRADTDVPGHGTAPGTERHFQIDAPRFVLPPDEIAGVFPPRNGQGAFHDSLPLVTLRRRTLPWERKLAASPPPAPPSGQNDPPPLAGRRPWMALLLFEEGEYTLFSGIALEEAVPPGVFARLAPPAGVRCDAVELDFELLTRLLPSVEELELLAHVRLIHTADRVPEAGDSDGWFAVVAANRLPSPGARCRACLVSLEERTDSS